MSNTTLRTNARTTGKAVFHTAPGTAPAQSFTFPENTAVQVRFRPSGEFDLWLTVENDHGPNLTFVRRDVPRSAFELIAFEVSN